MTGSELIPDSVKAAMKATFISLAPKTQEAISKLIKKIQK